MEDAMERLRFIDSDAHVFEPEDLWENYLESKYLPLINSYVNYKRETPESDLAFGIKVQVGENIMPFSRRDSVQREPLPGLGDAYEEYARDGFPPHVYKKVMENSGIDYMIVYPTVGLYTTAVPDLDPEAAVAIRRAYNSWLGDFCSEAGGRVFGAAAIDLRDPDSAIKEARRCVKDLDFKAVYLNPTPVGNHRLYDDIYDPLWAEIADLGVPVGIHPAAGNAADMMIYHYLPELLMTQGIVAFSMGNMLACAAFIMGGVLERHPKLRVVFLESGAGWVAYWLERLSSGVNGGRRGLEVPGLGMQPVEYFQRQCFVSADQDDPGIKMVIDAVGDDNIVTATDFSHPEGRRFGEAAEMLMDLPGVSMESKRKIMWDNALRLYPVEPAE
jgi:predicted TIM-barrel fold metal-dependent hydrolase